ncbi:MAG: OprD family outer membrane porin [Sulfuricurvum sp.]|jgi:hypothetical protein
MRFDKLSIVVLSISLFTISALALKTEDRVLKSNYQIDYLKVPGEVDIFSEIFTKGDIYGRLRSNNFWYDFDAPDTVTAQDHDKFGVGGNITYKTAFFNGFGATAGFYAAVPLGADNIEAGANYTKTAKDLYRTRVDGSEAPIGVAAVAYGEYKTVHNDVMIGRQIVDSILLSSNDAKMVPNTFEGAMFQNSNLPETKIRLGYLMSQKLRDHQNFHSIVAYAVRDENDDGASHKGLSVINLDTVHMDVNPEMIFADVENKSIKNLKLNGEYIGINGFFETLIAEMSYTIDLGSGWKLVPGIRYLQQFDDGAGAVGGASIAGTFGIDKSPSGAVLGSYNNPHSLDGSLMAARASLAQGPASITFGYSAVADKSDIVAPWRGFPTGGYTRAMAQTNWLANTKSWMLNGTYDFDQAKIIPGLSCSASYSSINIDDVKTFAGSIASSDRDVIYADAIQTFASVPNTEFKFRFANVDAVTNTKTGLNDSYSEYRFEINYLF